MSCKNGSQKQEWRYSTVYCLYWKLLHTRWKYSDIYNLSSVNKIKNNSNTTFCSEFLAFLKPFSMNCENKLWHIDVVSSDKQEICNLAFYCCVSCCDAGETCIDWLSSSPSSMRFCPIWRPPVTQVGEIPRSYSYLIISNKYFIQ